jgi:uncharacterized protein YebE (UPF0316 family)
MYELTQSIYFEYIILPLLICLARIFDVAIGTLRIIFVAKGLKKLAPLLGFFEVLIWLLAISQVMQNLTNVVNYLAYAFGFAIGNYIGMWIEQKLALGMVVVRIITKVAASNLIDYMKEQNFGVTSIDGEGSNGPVNLIFTVIKRTDLPRVIEKIKQFNPKAFYSIEDVRFVSEGVFPENGGTKKSLFSSLTGLRKSK